MEAQEGVPRFVREVVDGRTVELDDGRKVRISLLAEPAACWAAAAIAFATKTLLVRSVRVTTIEPGEANLQLDDGTDYAFLAVREGVLRAQSAAGEVADAEVLAARENRGLWGLPCNGMDAAPATTTVLSATVSSTTTPPKLVQPPKPVTTTSPPPPASPVVTTPPLPPPVPPCAVSYRVSGQWPGGFQAGVTIKNTGRSAINGWTLRWSFGDGQAVQNMWNASSSQRGAAVSATNAPYVATIAPGAEVSIGFIGSMRDRNAAPASFTLNGTACKKG